MNPERPLSGESTKGPGRQEEREGNTKPDFKRSGAGDGEPDRPGLCGDDKDAT